MLLHCVTYHTGHPPADTALTDISDALNEPDSFVWVALRDASAAELAQMQAAFELHDLAVEDANHGHQRPKIEEYDDEIFAVMHLIEDRPQPNRSANGKDKDSHPKTRVGEMHVFVGKNYIVSVHNRTCHDMSTVRTRCERSPDKLALGPGFVFYALMDAVVDLYFPLIEELETEFEQMENHLFTRSADASGRMNMHRMYRLKRRVSLLKHAVAPLMEAVSRLYSARVPAVCENCRDDFRDVYDHLLRLNGKLDTIRETISIAVQVNLALISLDQTEVSKRLAAWAGIFAVVTAFVGIWGMNFHYMPELEWEFGYPAALGLIAATVALLYWRFRKARWL
ncbi:magnesium transport protein CorA [Betaproteobacteria bacterium]|nr:magnesium transport protein CorA [Betaproteobacteria bacterium]